MNDRYWQLEIRELVGGIISHDLANVDDIVIKLPADTCHSIGFWLPNFSENVTHFIRILTASLMCSREKLSPSHIRLISLCFPNLQGNGSELQGILRITEEYLTVNGIK